MAKKLSFLVIFLINFIFTLIVFTTPNWQQISITNLSNPSKSSTYFLGIWFTCHTGDQANEYTDDLFYKYYLEFRQSNKSSSPSTSELISTSRIVTYSSLGLPFISNTCIWTPWNPFYTTQKILFCTSILYGFCFLAILVREFGDNDKYGVTLVGCIFYLLLNGKINLKIYNTHFSVTNLNVLIISPFQFITNYCLLLHIHFSIFDSFDQVECAVWVLNVLDRGDFVFWSPSPRPIGIHNPRWNRDQKRSREGFKRRRRNEESQGD